MANKISIINSRTVLKKMERLISLALFGGVLYGGGILIDSCSQDSKYIWRRSNIEKLVEKGELQNASSLLVSYSKGNSIEEADINTLQLRIEQAKKDEEIGKLELLIKECDYVRAQVSFNQIREDGVLDEEQSKKYAEQLNSILPEELLKKIKQLVGEEKVDLIDRFLQNNPSFEDSRGLRREQLESYILTANSYFETDAAGDKVKELLKRFDNFLSSESTQILGERDFSEFFVNANHYVLRQSLKYDPEMHIGDRVRTVRRLGTLNGEDENSYYSGNEEVPLFAKGVIVNKDTSNYPMKVKMDSDNNTYWFAVRELEKIEEDKKFAEINQYLDIIKKRVGNKLGEEQK